MMKNKKNIVLKKKGVRKIDTPLGYLYIISTESGIIKITSRENIENNSIGKQHLDSAERWLISYFNGSEIKRPELDYLDMTEFQKKTLDQLMINVKFGETISYSELAILIKNRSAVRAIGTTMAKNPWPIIIPCHRVIKKDNSIGKYSGIGGIKGKRILLEHEGIKVFN